MRIQRQFVNQRSECKELIIDECLNGIIIETKITNDNKHTNSLETSHLPYALDGEIARAQYMPDMLITDETNTNPNSATE